MNRPLTSAVSVSGGLGAAARASDVAGAGSAVAVPEERAR
jgi:hypothetical protein